MGRKVIAEALGTFVLVFVAVGAAITGFDTVGPLGVALAFGFVLLALAYAIGPISGCHVNPAVTLGVLLNRGISAGEAGAYVLAQVVGAVAAGGLLKLLVVAGGVTDQTGSLGTNSWGVTVNLLGALIVEILLTAVLVLVVLLVTHANAAPGFAGLAIGLVLTVVHLVGIPLTGTSVNPARSIGPAVFAGSGALSQLWLFIVAPLVGGLLAAGVYRLLAGASSLAATSSNDPTAAAPVDR